VPSGIGGDSFTDTVVRRAVWLKTTAGLKHTDESNKVKVAKAAAVARGEDGFEFEPPAENIPKYPCVSSPHLL
jgi:hypothetical protein